jgi:hypothetical protein
MVPTPIRAIEFIKELNARQTHIPKNHTKTPKHQATNLRTFGFLVQYVFLTVTRTRAEGLARLADAWP